jgi:DNA-binding NtrC family response regulator
MATGALPTLVRFEGGEMTPADAPRDSFTPATPAPQSRTVLVVDDDVLVRVAICENLRDAGFQVLEATSAHDALGVMLADMPIDVLLTDLQMPGAMDGFGLALAARGAAPDMKVLVMSSFLPESTGARLSPFEFIEKPFRPQSLIDRVRAMLGEADA